MVERIRIASWMGTTGLVLSILASNAHAGDNPLYQLLDKVAGGIEKVTGLDQCDCYGCGKKGCDSGCDSRGECDAPPADLVSPPMKIKVILHHPPQKGMQSTKELKQVPKNFGQSTPLQVPLQMPGMEGRTMAAPPRVQPIPSPSDTPAVRDRQLPLPQRNPSQPVPVTPQTLPAVPPENGMLPLPPAITDPFQDDPLSTRRTNAPMTRPVRRATRPTMNKTSQTPHSPVVSQASYWEL